MAVIEVRHQTVDKTKASCLQGLQDAKLGTVDLGHQVLEARFLRALEQPVDEHLRRSRRAISRIGHERPEAPHGEPEVLAVPHEVIEETGRHHRLPNPHASRR